MGAKMLLIIIGEGSIEEFSRPHVGVAVNAGTGGDPCERPHEILAGGKRSYNSGREEEPPGDDELPSSRAQGKPRTSERNRDRA